MNIDGKLKEIFKKLNLGIFEYFFDVKNTGSLPEYKGSTIRGGFGFALKKMSCILSSKKECIDCILSDRCLYATTFETVNKEKTEQFFDKYDYYPHPFVIDIDDNRTEYNPGDKLKFKMTLFGNFTDNLPYYIYAIKRAGKRGFGKNKKIICNLENVHIIDKNNEKIMVYNGKEDKLEKEYVKYTFSLLEYLTATNIKLNNEVKIKFLTPCRIREKEVYVKVLEFIILIKSILLRISGISKNLLDIEDNKLDTKKILKETELIKIKERNTNWYNWVRYSNRQKRKINMGGIKGEIIYNGKNLNKFIDLLNAGSILHIGKGTVMGLGKYEIVN